MRTVEVDGFRNSAPEGRDVSELHPVTMMESLFYSVHKNDALHPNSTEFVFLVLGAEHDYRCSAKIEYVDEADDEESWAAPHRHTEFVDAVLPALDLPETEPVQYFCVAFRISNFAVATIVMQANGDTHDAMTAPFFNTPLCSPLGASEGMIGAFQEMAQRFWGKAWVAERCHHNKRPPEGGLMMVIEPDDDGD